MKVLDLFSGIGGFSLGLERAGFETIAFCEIEPYCHKVLKKHWPDVPIYEDVRHVTRERLDADGIFPDVITGGFPCQDISCAGKQAGINGERSGLWSECARILGEVRPRYAIFENVTALLSGDNGKWFERVLWDISQVGYDAEWHCIPAYYVGSPQYRDRVWIVAHRERGRLQGRIGRQFDSIETARKRAKQLEGLLGEERALAIPTGSSGGVSDGIPNRAHRLRGLGNAVVPQIPELIGRAILQAQD